MVRSPEVRVLNALSVVNELSGRGVLGKRMALIGESAQGICFVLEDVLSASSRYANCLRLSCGYSWHARIEQGLKTQAR